MRAALLISGYSRTLKENIKLIREGIVKQFDTVDIYLHLTMQEAFEDKYLNPNDTISYEDIISELSPFCIVSEVNFHSKSGVAENIKNAWRKLSVLNQIKRLNELSLGVYQVVIRMRPDLFITDDQAFSFLRSYPNSIVIPEKTKFDSARYPKGDLTPLCDSFAYGPSDLMDKYARAYDYFLNLKNLEDLPPEIAFASYAKQVGLPVVEADIKYHYVMSQCNVIAIAGDSASGKSTLGNRLKMHFKSAFVLECDRYHKWERSSDNWADFTHLHPEANYIAKMQEDVFDLKIGNSIYQVDYDHVNGRFTEPEEINPAENLIVCGLHSISNAASTLFDLSVFLEPEPELRENWKITRDISKRNRSREEVIDQINSRRKDYESFVEPQRNDADLVVGFIGGREDFGGVSHITLKLKTKTQAERLRKSFEWAKIETDEFEEQSFLIDVNAPLNRLNIRQRIGYIDDSVWDLIVFAILSLPKRSEYDSVS
jgi:uridine kinase